MSGGAAGVVLAGGRGRRMGGPKESLLVGGVTLLERAVGVLAASGADPIFCAFGFGDERTAPPPARALRDRALGRGPLEGLAVALEAAGRARRFALLVAPCDVPLLDPGLFELLLAHLGGAACAVPCSPAGLEPLCAVYRTALAPLALRLADEGHGSPRALLDRAEAEGQTVRLLSADTLAAAAIDPATSFLNANTPEDLERIRDIDQRRR